MMLSLLCIVGRNYILGVVCLVVKLKATPKFKSNVENSFPKFVKLLPYFLQASP